jgi:cell division protein FtsL
MVKAGFLRIIFLLSLVVAVVKIYQHNQIIRLRYEKQRIENKQDKLRKEKNELLAELSRLKDNLQVIEMAKNNLKMDDLKMSQILTLTLKSSVDFYATRSSNKI